VLQADLGGHLRAGRLDDRLGIGDGVQDQGVRGVEDPRRRLGAAHPLDALRREHDGGTVGAHDLDHPRHALAVGDRRELVDDQQDLLAGALAPGKVLLEVLDEEARELGRLLRVEQLVEQHVGAVGVLPRPVAVELAGRSRRRTSGSADGRHRCARRGSARPP